MGGPSDKRSLLARGWERLSHAAERLSQLTVSRFSVLASSDARLKGTMRRLVRLIIRCIRVLRVRVRTGAVCKRRKIDVAAFSKHK